MTGDFTVKFNKIQKAKEQLNSIYGVRSVLNDTNKMKFRQHKRLLKYLVKFDFTHIFTPYQQRCVDETIRIIKLNITYHKTHKRNKGQ